MATYKEIENLRISKRHYVKYDYNKIDKDFLDSFGFNPSLRYCRYLVTGKDTQVKKIDVIKGNFLTHDYKLKESNPTGYKLLETKLKENLAPRSVYELNRKKHYEAVLSQFVNISTINNNKENPAVRNMLYACASIDFNAVIKDLDKACNNDEDMTKLLKALYFEVNAAALNGLFARLFILASKSGKKSKDDFKVEPVIEQAITNLYNKTMFGDAVSKPLQIPTYPQTDFPLLTYLNNRIEVTQYLGNLSTDEFIKRVFNPFSSVLSRALEAQQNKENTK